MKIFELTLFSSGLILPILMKKALAHGASDPANIIGRPGMICTMTYSSGFPVLSDTALLSSARQVLSSLMVSADTFVSIRRLGIAEC